MNGKQAVESPDKQTGFFVEALHEIIAGKRLGAALLQQARELAGRENEKGSAGD
ncbi:MAG: hypothetical protein NC924_03770 [Candidatus Omnitrophica bacterium]|nr:hypothetical protein [Candidatus Omnitrophota bacterium]